MHTEQVQIELPGSMGAISVLGNEELFSFPRVWKQETPLFSTIPPITNLHSQEVLAFVQSDAFHGFFVRT